VEENPTKRSDLDLESLWVCNKTDMVYAVKFLDDEFVLARPLAPALYHVIRRIATESFASEFHQYCGNYDEVRALLEGDGNFVVIQNH
jgi:hypothetical protein